MRPPCHHQTEDRPDKARPSSARTRTARGGRAARTAALLALLTAIITVFHSSASYAWTSGARASAYAAPTAVPAAERDFASAFFSPVLFQEVAAFESVQTYDADCATPKTDFVLGDTVCVKASVPFAFLVGRRNINIIGPSNVVRASLGVAGLEQTLSFTLPTTPQSVIGDETFDNRGTWRADLATLGGSRRASADFDVSGATPTADLQIVSVVNGDGTVPSGGSLSVTVYVFNRGPNAAANVLVTPPVGNGFALQSFAPASGPACDGTCSIASLGVRSVAAFLATYDVTGAAGSKLVARSSVTSDTPDPRPTFDYVVDEQNPAPPANTNVDSISVAISGSTNPNPTCTISCPADITVSAATGQSGATVTFSGPTTGGTCGPITTTPASGSFFGIGSTAVTSSTEDGESCSFMVTVTPAVDTTNPTISCPADITVTESSPSANSATVSYAVTAADNSGTVNVNCDPPSDSSFPTGTTEVRCTATDSSGNTAECAFNVTVNQDGCDLDANSPAPVPNVASLPTVTRSCSVTLLPTDDPTATDACGATISGEVIKVNGQDSSNRTYEVPGTYTVTWSYTDSAGHITTQDQTFIISPDNSAPVPDAASLPTITGECSAAITGNPPTASDNCGGSGIEGTPLDPLSYNTPGTHIVRWKFVDPAGNSTIQNQTVVVTDNSAPVPDVASLPTLTGECSVTVTPPTATDSCAGAITATTSDPTTYTAQGTHIVHWTYTDAAGNTATQDQTVIVDDNTAPVVTLSGPSSVTVECHTSYTDLGATATDNCSPAPAPTANSNVDVNTPGTYQVVWSATDAGGNTATATRTVNVVDTTPPVITPPANVVVYLPLNSTATSRVVNYPNPATATDSCGGSISIDYSPASGSVFPVGTSTVTITATDSHNNSSTATFTVTVLYNFTGFFSPVNNLPTLNKANGGQNIPLKFSLSGNKGLAIFAPDFPASQQISCVDNVPVNELEETNSPGGSTLTYSPDTYHYNWKTEKLWAGTCRVLVIMLNDGSTHTAYFKFK